MRSNRRHCLTGCVVVLFMVASCSFIQEPGARLSDSEKDAIRKEMERRYRTEAEAAIWAKQYGERSIPFLIEMLKSEKTSPYAKYNVCFSLGKTGDPRAVKPIIELIEAPMPEQLTLDERNMYCFAISSGLGFIGSDDVLSYLRKLASEDYWLSRPDRPTGKWGRGIRSAEYLRRDFRIYALLGIANAAPVTDKVIKILEELKQGEAADLKPHVDAAIQHAQPRLKPPSPARPTQVSGPDE